MKTLLKKHCHINEPQYILTVFSKTNVRSLKQKIIITLSIIIRKVYNAEIGQYKKKEKLVLTTF